MSYDYYEDHFNYERDIKINSKGYIKIPTGTTTERPSLGEKGMVRFNTEI